MTDLQTLLELTTDEIQSPNLARTALATAHRRRTRRRGGIAAVAAGVVVASVAMVPRLFASTEPVREPIDTPVPDPQVSVVPPIDEKVIQEPWDPARVDELPWENRTLLPTDLTPGASDDRTGERLVAVVDDGSRLHIVTDGERWQTLDNPETLLDGGDSAVSPDGQRVIVTGATGLWSRDVDTSKWTRVDYPEGFRTTSWRGVLLMPREGASTYLAQGDRTWLVDLETGASDVQPFSLVQDNSTLSSRGVVTLGLEGSTRTIVEWEPGPRVLNADALEFLAGPLADSGSLLAAARANESFYLPRKGADQEGLLVLDRTDFTTVAYLPVIDENAWVEHGGLRALDWLADGSVLISVRPPSTGERLPDTRYLVTWNPRTGDLARVSSLPAAYDLSLATDVID